MDMGRGGGLVDTDWCRRVGVQRMFPGIPYFGRGSR